MPSSDLVDERFDDIVRELRLLPGASPALRERVSAIAAREPEPPAARRRLRLRFLPAPRWGMYAAAGFASVVVVAVVYGIASSGGGPQRSAAEPAAREQASTTVRTDSASSGGGVFAGKQRAPSPVLVGPVPPPAPPPPNALSGADRAAVGAPAATTAESARTLAPVSLPTANGRLQRYEATMRLRVKDVDQLSDQTAKAMRIARSLGGFVAVVRYATPQGGEGDAFLQLRIPAQNVQEAVVRFSQLGTILSQRVRIVDLQDRVNQATDDITRVRRTIHRLEAALAKPLPEDERYRLQLQLDNARATLKRLTTARENTVRAGRLSTVSLSLTTREGTVVPAKPHHPGRIERSARNALSFLSHGAAVAVFLVIVLSPLLLLGAAAAVANGYRRRRLETRLLEAA
jgi:hypothetical protein